MSRFEYWTAEDYVFSGLMIVLGLLTAWLFPLMIISAKADAACMELGYPTTSISWKYETYCYTRVDQTDYLVPLEEAKNLPRPTSWEGGQVEQP